MKFSKRSGFTIGVLSVCAVILVAFGVAGVVEWRLRQPVDPVTAGNGAVTTVMDFAQPLSVDNLPPGWVHRKFWTKQPMKVSLVTKQGVPALRCETNASASMLARWTDIDIGRFPRLTWRWFVEATITSKRDERERTGDDHPIRFFLSFDGDDGQTRNAEIIWGNRRFGRGDWKLIGAFPHYVADGGDANARQWRDESADLLEIFRKAGGTGNARLKQIAIFCDSDDTGGHTVAYVGGPVLLEKR